MYFHRYQTIAHLFELKTQFGHFWRRERTGGLHIVIKDRALLCRTYQWNCLLFNINPDIQNQGSHATWVLYAICSLHRIDRLSICLRIPLSFLGRNVPRRLAANSALFPGESASRSLLPNGGTCFNSRSFWDCKNIDLPKPSHKYSNIEVWMML